MSIYEIISAKSATVIAKDAPRNPPIKRAATMADLIADAFAADQRQRKAWGEHLGTDTDSTPSCGQRTTWTPERMAQLRGQIIAALTKHGPMTLEDLNHHVRINRHKLRDTMAEFRKEGIAERKQITKLIHRWSLV